MRVACPESVEIVLPIYHITYDNRVMSEIVPIAADFSARGQFSGFAGSSGPSQSTIFGSDADFSSTAFVVTDEDLPPNFVAASIGVSWGKPLF
jgi:hypothetical protein